MSDDIARLPKKLREHLEREPELEAELEERARAGHKQPVCPACGVRPANHARTGWCRTCSYRRLSRAYEERVAEEQARKEYWLQKSRSKRQTTCVECGEVYSPRLDSEGRESDRTLCPECRERDVSRDTG